MKKIDYVIGAIVTASVLWGAFVVWTTPQKATQVAANTPQAYAASINKYRVARGLAPLTFDKGLTKGAQETALENARAGRLMHASNCGAEIIAYNYEGFDSAVNQWHNSPGHRSIMASTRYRRVGCATVGRNGRFYCWARFK